MNWEHTSQAEKKVETDFSVLKWEEVFQNTISAGPLLSTDVLIGSLCPWETKPGCISFMDFVDLKIYICQWNNKNTGSRCIISDDSCFRKQAERYQVVQQSIVS